MAKTIFAIATRFGSKFEINDVSVDQVFSDLEEAKDACRGTYDEGSYQVWEYTLTATHIPPAETWLRQIVK